MVMIREILPKGTCDEVFAFQLRVKILREIGVIAQLTQILGTKVFQRPIDVFRVEKSGCLGE